MPLSGSLEDFEITDVLQVIHISNKDGVLYIRTPKGRALMFFKGGLLLHAEIEDAVGMDAVRKIIILRQGTFEFRPGESTSQVTIELPIQNVIIEAARQIDEWKQMKKIIPSVNIIVDFVEEPEISKIELKPDEWKILTSVDGKKSLKEIAKSLTLDEFTVAKTLYGLISSGLLKVTGEKQEEEKKEEKKEEEDKKRGGFFRRR
uniref:DUF4388 domain-containing protein n=1 Tax=candidate division WOR-3 bacterium TaxID=2052148 RepID=A0A7C4YAP7_UNCW3